MLSKYSLSNSPFSASYPHYVLYMKYSEALHKFMLFCERNVYGCKAEGGSYFFEMCINLFIPFHIKGWHKENGFF